MKNKLSTQEILENEIKSPCIRNCCLNEEDICIGCFRHLNDILAWTKANKEQKLAMLKQAELIKNKLSKE